MIIEQKNSLDVSLHLEKDYDNNIYYFILSALLGGRSIYEKNLKLKLNDGEQRQLVDNNGFSPPGERIDTDSLDKTNIEIITRSNGRGVIIEEWEKLEVIASNALL